MTILEPVTPPFRRLDKDTLRKAKELTRDEARYIVDYYYIMQEDRKRAHNQVRALDESNENNAVVSWLADNAEGVENQIKRVLEAWSDESPLGVWAKSHVGIGPVIASGLLAHIDLEKAPTVGHIWRFAGLDPTLKWEKGQKRPWNANLKTLCWKIGQSFMKFSGHEQCVYGHRYRERKAYEVARNESGANAERAKLILLEKKFKSSTDAFGHLTAGHLPPAQIDAMARRWAVKLFLSHYHEAGYRLVLGKEPPFPYPIAILGHAHRIAA